MVTYQTLSIATGDKILDSINPGNVSGYETITNVSSALDSTTGKYVYTITTASHTLKVDASMLVESSENNSAVRTWVAGKSQ